LAVNLQISIHRQDAKNAKKSAKQTSFPAAENFYLSNTDRIRQIRANPRAVARGN
jgi:hypothetical protein